MEWIEEKSDIKFVDWGKLKPDHTKDDAVVFEKGKSYEATINTIRAEERQNQAGDLITDYKYRLVVKGEDKEVLLWSNAAIRRQHETLGLKEGDIIEITYVDDYETNFGQKGRNVKLRVQR